MPHFPGPQLALPYPVERWLFTLVSVLLAIAPSAEANCEKLLRTLSEYEREQKHQEILTDLENGVVIAARTGRANQNAHDLWFIDIRNPSTGRTRKAIMKPREWGDSNGWARSPMELVAYRLNRFLNLDYVPPTVYRHQIPVRSVNIPEAPLLYFVPRTSVLFQTDESSWGLSKLAVQSDNRILNVLLHNSDAHHKNLLLGEHWAEEGLRPVFIDFGASLRAGTQVSMTHYPAKGNSGAITKVRHSTLTALKNLRREQLETLRAFITPEEIDGILQRRDGIVRYFEALIDIEGPEQVILSE